MTVTYMGEIKARSISSWQENLMVFTRFLSVWSPMLAKVLVKFWFHCFVKVLFCIQLFRQRLSHKSVKAYATMPIGIMGRKSLALID